MKKEQDVRTVIQNLLESHDEISGVDGKLSTEELEVVLSLLLHMLSGRSNIITIIGAIALAKGVSPSTVFDWERRQRNGKTIEIEPLVRSAESA